MGKKRRKDLPYAPKKGDPCHELKLAFWKLLWARCPLDTGVPEVRLVLEVLASPASGATVWSSVIASCEKRNEATRMRDDCVMFMTNEKWCSPWCDLIGLDPCWYTQVGSAFVRESRRLLRAAGVTKP